MQWFVAFRPLCGITTALLVISGYAFANQVVDWTIVFTVFCITSMAMLWNDYQDRTIDVGKGKMLANDNPHVFLLYASSWIVISLFLSIIVLSNNLFAGLICLSMWLISILYGQLQNNPVIKNITVSATVAASALFPLSFGVSNFSLWTFALLVMFTISVREYLKDVEDMRIDRGRKNTLPLLLKSRISENTASRRKWFVTIMLFVFIFFALGF